MSFLRTSSSLCFEAGSLVGLEQVSSLGWLANKAQESNCYSFHSGGFKSVCHHTYRFGWLLGTMSSELWWACSEGGNGEHEAPGCPQSVNVKLGAL